MSIGNDTWVRIGVGDKILVIDQSIGESQELLAEVIEVRRILGRPTYLVETEAGDRRLVGDRQVRSIEYSKSRRE